MLNLKLKILYQEKYGQRVRNEDSIINSSNVPLPPEVVEIVSLGPKFNVKSNFLSKIDIVDSIRNLESPLSIIEIDNNVKM